MFVCSFSSLFVEGEREGGGGDRSGVDNHVSDMPHSKSGI